MARLSKVGMKNRERHKKQAISYMYVHGVFKAISSIPAKLLPTLLALLLPMVAGCARQNSTATIADLERIANEQLLVVHTLSAPPFSLVALSPKSSSGSVLRVYIEGDGQAWLTRSRLSSDPTPVNPLALVLMEVDTAPDKAYLARPCQYIQTAACNSSYWSIRRFSPEVIDSMDEALTQLKTSGNYQSLELIGYSGGGTVALLLAARRNDIVSLRTIAGNLDHAWLNKHHRVSPLTGSLNPPDFTERLGRIPQRHFIGENDRVVPVGVYSSYVGSFKNSRCISLQIVEGVGHGNGWEKKWPQYLKEIPTCNEGE
jgi:hypothetical protein